MTMNDGLYDFKANPFFEMSENLLKEWCARQGLEYIERGQEGRERLNALYDQDCKRQQEEADKVLREKRRTEFERARVERYEAFVRDIPARYRDASISDLTMKASAQKVLDGAPALILGNNGAGKNHFVWALAKEWKKKDESVRIEKAQEMLYRIKLQDDPYGYIRREYMERVKHLVIDEIDKIFESKADFVYLNFLIDMRYEWVMQTVVLGNGDREGFIGVLGQSIYSRLTGEGGVYIQHTGRDRRKDETVDNRQNA